ncbi:MAG: glycosyltransferase family 2 protein [Leifsonia flava]
MTGVDVSVVIPAYNAAEFLGDAVERLLRQTIAVEIVVVDDGSRDSTARVGAALAERHPSVVFVPLAENGGVAAAREAGVAASSGRFIWFVDADDEWTTDAAETLLAAADGFAADVVCAGAEYLSVDGSRRPVPSLPPGTVDGATAFRAMLLGRVSGHLWNKLFARRLFPAITFTRSRVHSDQAMVAQLLVAAETVAGIRDTVYTYRLRSGSIIRSNTQRAQSLEQVGAVVRDCARRVGAGDGRELEYYTARFSLLSRMKDATSGAYTEQESRALVRTARGEMTPAVVLSLARAREPQRFALLVAARTSMPLYRRIMSSRGARE